MEEQAATPRSRSKSRSNTRSNPQPSALFKVGTLSNGDFTKAKLMGVWFTNPGVACHLERATFVNGKISYCYFGCDITGTTFTNNIIKTVTFAGSVRQEDNVYLVVTFEGVDFGPHTHFTNVKFKKNKKKVTTFNNVTFGENSNFEEVSFADAVFNNVVFRRGCKLTGVDFTGATLNEVTFEEGCILQGALFNNISLQGQVFFVASDLCGSSFEGVKRKGKTRINFNRVRLSPSDLGAAVRKLADDQSSYRLCHLEGQETIATLQQRNSQKRATRKVFEEKLKHAKVMYGKELEAIPGAILPDDFVLAPPVREETITPLTPIASRGSSASHQESSADNQGSGKIQERLKLLTFSSSSSSGSRRDASAEAPPVTPFLRTPYAQDKSQNAPQMSRLLVPTAVVIGFGALCKARCPSGKKESDRRMKNKKNSQRPRAMAFAVA